MDSWPTSREVEKVKPFAERAAKAAADLLVYRNAMTLTRGDGNTPMLRSMTTAAQLLDEAVTRGVKGKDLGR